MPERLKKDPVLKTVEDLDRVRLWLVFLGGITAILTVAVVVLAFTLYSLSSFVRQPAGRDNRMEFQCQVQRALDLPRTDCP